MAKTPAPRLGLSRNRILRAALDVADADGVESLTMRRLGESLGFEAMSLYHYVRNKDDVLDGILDLVLDESRPPSDDGDWTGSVRDSAISVHGALQRHPWACTILSSPARLRPARLRYMDSLLRRLRAAGFPAETTYHAYHVLDGFIFGFSLWEAQHTYTDAETSAMAAAFSATVNADTYPDLVEHGQQHFSDGPIHDVSAFEFGLDLILNGLLDTLEGRSPSP
jgi:AcrR family transcriptional regulator